MRLDQLSPLQPAHRHVASGTRASHRPAFYSVSAQPDNLGDIVIRDVVLRWLVEAGLELHVLTAGMPDSYVESFALPDEATRYTDRVTFQAAILRAAARGRRPALVGAPGPRVGASGPLPSHKALAAYANVLLARLSRGSSVWIGGSYRSGSATANLLQRGFEKHGDLIVTRDAVDDSGPRSQRLVAPDVALSGASTVEWATRPHVLALSFRNDRAVDREVVVEVVERARAHGLEPVFVVQVRRDDDLNESLARACGAEFVGWGSASHGEQLSRVVDIYSRSAVVVSDRLHALLLGVRAGAVPVSSEIGEGGKVSVTLDAAGIPYRRLHERAGVLAERVVDVDPSDRSQLRLAVEAADQRLHRVREDLHSVLLG